MFYVSHGRMDLLHSATARRKYAYSYMVYICIFRIKCGYANKVYRKVLVVRLALLYVILIYLLYNNNKDGLI